MEKDKIITGIEKKMAFVIYSDENRQIIGFIVDFYLQG